MTARAHLSRIHLDLECELERTLTPFGGPIRAQINALKRAIAVCDAVEVNHNAQCSGIGVCLTSVDDHDEQCAVTIAGAALWSAARAYVEAK